ncbi:MAG: ABC transporter substrate-binding protein [Candidatus Sulfotelmatobacter sp.]|jgi:ABC-type transport system substrate-binding protein
MRRFGWHWLAASSLLIGALVAHAERRPQYGGTLHVAMHAAPLSLDPADRSVPDSFGRRSLTALIFDTLVTLDSSGQPKPALGESWQTAGNQRWQFRLRHGVQFQDGTPLTAEAVASSLRFANPSWKVRAEGESIIIELDAPGYAVSESALLEELALPRNAIAKRNADGTLNGTGPFHVTEWQPAKHLTLAAEENCWRGRPFLDGIEIELGKTFRDQMTALQMGKEDLVEIAPEQARRVSQEGRQLVSSPPIELLALLFVRDPSSPEDKSLRDALGWSVERGSIRDVLLQGSGQPTGSILPTWMGGYGFVFSSTADLPKARQLRGQAHSVPSWKLGYDNGDPLNKLLAERIALNAVDAGLSLQPTPGSGGDLRLVRIPLASPDPWIALQQLIAQAGLPAAMGKGNSIEDLYADEQALLATRRLIPLFHLPVSYASATGLKGWTLRTEGAWDLSDAWLENRKP